MAKIFAEGFDLPTLGGAVFAAILGRRGWHAVVALENGEPVAAAVLSILDRCGYMAGAATAPGFRCRGSQAAPLHARIEMALDAGCHTLVTETGEAVAGDPQHSYRNLEKIGFRTGEVPLRARVIGSVERDAFGVVRAFRRG